MESFSTAQKAVVKKLCCLTYSLFDDQQIKTFKDYVGLYLKARDDEDDLALGSESEKKTNSVVHEVVNKRWEVCVTTSTKGFQQASFVNSIATTKVQ